MTYDHLLNQGERLLQVISNATAAPDEQEDDFGTWDGDVDGPPF